MLRLGILLPRSTLFPAIGHDILNGIKACLRHYEIFDDFKLLTENIGFGTNELEIYSKAEKLLLQEDADLVIVMADTRIGELLEPLFTASKKILMMVNFGANTPDTWQPAPTTIVHSLNFCLQTWLTGKMAAEESENKKGAYTASYFDAGYRQCFHLMNRHQAHGGLPLYTHVTHLKMEEFTLQPLAAFFQQEADVQSLLCLFSGDMAARFYNDIAPLQQQHALKLYVGPMMLEEGIKDEPGAPLAVQYAKGFTPWIPGLTNGNNHAFCKAFQQLADKPANYFALLGWETGLLLRGILQQHIAGNTAAAQILPALCNESFASPRGWMKLDSATFHTFGASWLVSCSGNMELKAEYEAAELDTMWQQFTAEGFPKGEHSSWRNTYLCI
jgi:branched-chain amino acid transport system substrate-binding protein